MRIERLLRSTNDALIWSGIGVNRRPRPPDRPHFAPFQGWTPDKVCSVQRHASLGQQFCAG